MPERRQIGVRNAKNRSGYQFGILCVRFAAGGFNQSIKIEIFNVAKIAISHY